MPAALPFRRYAGTVWRMVEAQHVVSTLRLVDSLEEQRVLEDILERAKPPLPAPCRHLHYLLGAPFRYGLYPADSRFRRAGHTAGVFYASEEARTAAMETVWYRLKFLADAPEMALPEQPGEYTAFSVPVAGQCADLTRPPLNAGHARWTDPDNYTACLELADNARASRGDMIRYQSVRDPDAGTNLAVLQCRAFARPAPGEHQSWRIFLRRNGAVIRREWPEQAWEVRVQGSALALETP